MANKIPGIKGVTREEIRQLLADTGYSESERRERLKTALTELSQKDAKNPDEETRALIAELRDAIHTSQSNEVVAQDEARER